MLPRREFLKTSAALASLMLLPLPSFAGTEKIKLAVLGTGWWGREFIIKFAQACGHFEIIALCDVDSVALAEAAKLVASTPGTAAPKLFSSYQEMYALPGLQAIAIATPTHWHALQFIDACKKGLHVFLEKPICYDIREGQAMLKAQALAQNVVQVDFPRVTSPAHAQVKDFIASGEAGKILQVQANINAPEAKLIEKEIPSTVDWNTYCGPAPINKFITVENGSANFFRGQHDFSRGILADWGIHYIHNARNILSLGLPDQVSAVGGTLKNFSHSNPDYLNVRYLFGDLPLHWSHKTWGYTATNPKYNIGVYYYGEKATIFAGDFGWQVFPANSTEIISHGDIEFTPGEPTHWPIIQSAMISLFTEFAEGIKTQSNKKITNTLGDAFNTTASIIYSDLAFLTESTLRIDHQKMNITNNKKAQQLSKRDYRKPYRHPYV